jgi:hypothetical protein
MALKFHVDAEALASQFGELRDQIEADIKKAVGALAETVKARIIDLVNEGEGPNAKGLGSTRNIYLSNLSNPEQTGDGVYVISLAEPALFIEEGLKPHDMKPDLLKKGKRGNKYTYKVIPFHYDKAPQDNTPYTQNVVNDIRKELKKKNIPFKKIEYNANGSPKVGKLHSFDFGGKIPGKGNTPVMKGVSVYQTLTKSGNVRRDILTFRTVSSGPGSEGKWMHPGSDAKKYMDKAMDEAQKIWDDKIWPKIQEDWGK